MSTVSSNPTLWDGIKSDVVRIENPGYLSEQLLTYLGNKRALLPLIDTALARIKRRMGMKTLAMLDAFSGSGVVSRLFKRHAHLLIANDFESYAAVVNRCYLANPSEMDLTVLREWHHYLLERVKEQVVHDGFLRKLYAPKDEQNIRLGERVFYTIDNAKRLDTFRSLIDQIPARYQNYFLGPLLSEASIRANTSGVFKGFYKDPETKLGLFGGRARNALTRILGPIQLPFPIFSRFEQEVHVYQENANVLVRSLPAVDVAYLDPPYNQHPYGSNYFMLNLLVDYQEPGDISPVSGIPRHWRRSPYNKKAQAAEALEDIIENTNAAFFLISYNDEGFIKRPEFDDILSRHGKYEVFEEQYNTFRGSRNLHARACHVTEQLFLLERN